MIDKNFEEYIKNKKHVINEFEAEKRYIILKDYIFASFNFVKGNKEKVFFDYLYSY